MEAYHPTMKRIERYLARRADLAARPLVVKDSGVEGVVVIPALRERDSLPGTLASLARNPEALLARTLVICVVNNRVDADSATRANNRATIEYLRDLGERRACGALRIAYIDAASPGAELGAKEGVGSARKIGMDWATQVLWSNGVPGGQILSLDADARVDAHYLQRITRHHWACVMAYAHSIDGSEAQQQAIVWYETFLRYWKLGLKYAGSPYYHHAIGSTMGCSAEAYASVAGMNCRQAGEDFYFLDKLAKSGWVDYEQHTVVRLSSRASDRVPFGTGRAVRDFQSSQRADGGAYHPEAFEILRKWIAILDGGRPLAAAEVLSSAHAIAPALREFLLTQRFEQTWSRLEANAGDYHSQLDPLRLSFRTLNCLHNLREQRRCWFGAFRTLKCLHYLRDHGFPNQPLHEAVVYLLERDPILRMQTSTTSAPRWRGPIETLEERIEFLHYLRSFT